MSRTFVEFQQLQPLSQGWRGNFCPGLMWLPQQHSRPAPGCWELLGASCFCLNQRNGNSPTAAKTLQGCNHVRANYPGWGSDRGIAAGSGTGNGMQTSPALLLSRAACTVSSTISGPQNTRGDRNGYPGLTGAPAGARGLCANDVPAFPTPHLLRGIPKLTPFTPRVFMAAPRAINDSECNQTLIWLCSFLRKRGAQSTSLPRGASWELFAHNPSCVYGKILLKSQFLNAPKAPNPFTVRTSERLCPAQSHNSIPCTGVKQNL